MTACFAPSRSRAARRAAALRSSAFDGMHAQYEHSPPTSSASTMTVVIPPCTVRSATFSPTAPAPITMTSYSRSLIPSRYPLPRARDRTRAERPLRRWRASTPDADGGQGAGGPAAGAGGLEPTGSWTRPLGHATRSCDDARPPPASTTPSRAPPCATLHGGGRAGCRPPSDPCSPSWSRSPCRSAAPSPPASATLLERATAPAAVAAAPLTNLAHLDFLLDEATPPADVAGHTTYRLAEEPTLILPWTYADARPGGTFQRVGGGPLDAATNTGDRARTTPTTSRVRPSCTCGTGS